LHLKWCWGDGMRVQHYKWVYALFLGVLVPYFLLNLSFDGLKNNGIREQERVSVDDPRIKVLMPDGTVQSMKLEEYVVCVVLAEMPAEFETEALKAQSVLARTYAIKKIGTDKHDGGMICTDASCCQGFCSMENYGGSADALHKIKDAAYATVGQMLYYNGELIEATYFSCSGGQTEDAAAVWGTDVPYLRSKESPGEEGTEHYISTVVMEQEDLMDVLGLNEQTLTVSNITYTDGGGVREVQLCDELFTGVQVRKLLQLPSTAFQMRVVGDSVIITSKGYGHRVGMSQYGANAMALKGSDYRQILAYYYEGTTLSE